MDAETCTLCNAYAKMHKVRSSCNLLQLFHLAECVSESPTMLLSPGSTAMPSCGNAFTMPATGYSNVSCGDGDHSDRSCADDCSEHSERCTSSNGLTRNAAICCCAAVQFQLGMTCANTEGGGPLAAKRAHEYFTAAACRGHIAAQFAVGVSCSTGYVITRDDTAASYWYRLAAEQGHETAQLNLAARYMRGLGVTASPQHAAYWYRRCASQGNAAAWYALGVVFLQGYGVPAQPMRAAQLFRRAAKLGDVDATFALEVLQGQHRWLHFGHQSRRCGAVVVAGIAQ